MKATIDISGIRNMKLFLSQAPKQIAGPILRTACRKLASIGSKEAKSQLSKLLPERDWWSRRWDTPTGALANSYGVKVTTRRRDGAIIGLFGPRKGFNKPTKRVQRRVKALTRYGLDTEKGQPFGRAKVIDQGSAGVNDGSPHNIDPTKYSHLVNFGHGGPLPARAYPYHSNAVAVVRRHLQPVARQVWNRRYPIEVRKAWKRYQKRGRAAGVV